MARIFSHFMGVFSYFSEWLAFSCTYRHGKSIQLLQLENKKGTVVLLRKQWLLEPGIGLHKIVKSNQVLSCHKSDTLEHILESRDKLHISVSNDDDK